MMKGLEQAAVQDPDCSDDATCQAKSQNMKSTVAFAAMDVFFLKMFSRMKELNWVKIFRKT